MPNRSSQRRQSLPDRRDRWRHWLPASPVRLAVLAAAVSVGVFAGIQLGNSAIADINPVHYRGAVLHPRERGAAVPDQPVRPAAPTYAALYGWDEGRAALAAERDNYDEPVSAAPPPIAAPPRRRRAAAQTWDAPSEPGRFRASVRDNEVRVHRGADYQSRDVYLPRGGGGADRGEDKPESFD
jgi:hypothetical protein